MTLTTRLRMMTVVLIIRDPRDLVRAQGHDEDVDDALSGGQARKNDGVAKKELRRQLNPFHRKITTVQLTPEPIIGL
jgi:hypothetical protein